MCEEIVLQLNLIVSFHTNQWSPWKNSTLALYVFFNTNNYFISFSKSDIILFWKMIKNWENYNQNFYICCEKPSSDIIITLA